MRVAFSIIALALSLSAETLTYDVEWRLIHAGRVTFDWNAQRASVGEASLSLESQGLVRRLYPVNDAYFSSLREGYCASSAGLRIQEGKRNREVKVVYPRGSAGKATFEERDLTKNTTVAKREVEVPACVHDVLGALMVLRDRSLEPGQSFTLPVSDGRKFANVRVEVQERETVKTPAGTFGALRCEVFLMNNVIYGRSGRVFLWLTDDARRVPVQVRVRLQILIGTVTLQLAKDGR